MLCGCTHGGWWGLVAFMASCLIVIASRMRCERRMRPDTEKEVIFPTSWSRRACMSGNDRFNRSSSAKHTLALRSMWAMNSMQLSQANTMQSKRFLLDEAAGNQSSHLSLCANIYDLDGVDNRVQGKVWENIRWKSSHGGKLKTDESMWKLCFEVPRNPQNDTICQSRSFL